MAKLRYGIVTFKGERAGVLSERIDGGTEFIYDSGAPEIACALPRAQDRHVYKAGVHPAFAHLAPEGWLRDRQKAVADTDAEDDLGLLLAFGADCIGAIGIEDREGSARSDLLIELDAETAAIATGHRTISGVQAKILCQKEGRVYVPATKDGPAPYIAKYARDSLPDLVGNEEFSLGLVRVLLPEDEVAVCERAFVRTIEPVALLVKRFDRVGDEKLRCEDFAQILGHAPGRNRKNKYNVGYEALSEALEYSDKKLIDAYRVFKRIVAFVLIGNTDCHLKNWSLYEKNGGLRLSPVYDVLNSYIYGEQGYSTAFGLLVDGRKVPWDQYDRDLLTRLGGKLGLTAKAIGRTFDEILSTQGAFEAVLAGNLPLSEDRTYQYRASLKKKWEQIYE
ncbi:type II toxin-antitoxin system HipA family toxin [Paremcibacter congregatus]|uniref:type II toxin-antitoxin system HipA family toxin n=1 Tax=Paremcibacter congregatus TaxID=2043170 RepID=UPI003A8FAC47